MRETHRLARITCCVAAEAAAGAEYTGHGSVDMGRVLFAHGHLLRFDRKQYAIGKPYPPLATITAAAYLRSLGHEVALYDPMLDDDTRGFAPALARVRPDVVVIYDDVFNWFTKMCLGRMREAALGMIAAARAAGARVIVSGHDSADAPEVYLHAGADFVAVGEAEITLGELLARMDAPADVPGLVFRDRGMVRRTGPALAAEGAGDAADRGVGSRRRRSLPRVLARAPRLFLAEREHDARLPVQVQLVLEAGLREHVSHAHARRRRRGDPLAARALRARSPLVLRRHLRAEGALADPVFRAHRRRRAGGAVPVSDARRSDDRRERRGAEARRLRRDLDGRRIGRAVGPRRDGQGHDASIRCAAPCSRLRAAGIRIGFFLQFGYPGEGWREIEMTRRPRPRADARRHRHLGQLPAARHALSRERARRAWARSGTGTRATTWTRCFRACSRASSIDGCRGRFMRNSGHAMRCARCAGWWPRPSPDDRQLSTSLKALSGLAELPLWLANTALLHAQVGFSRQKIVAEPVRKTVSALRKQTSRGVADLFSTGPEAYSMREFARARIDMTRRFKELMVLFLLGVSIALAPMACSDDNSNDDGGPRTMTPG